MEKPFDLVVVSAFERGAWLARDLSRRGLRVGLIDVTDQLGIHRRSDWEGPFGVHLQPVVDEVNNGDGAPASGDKTRDFVKTSWEFLNIHPMIEVAQGLTAWLDSGPVEFRSAHIMHRLDKLGVDPKILELIASGENGLSSQHRVMLRESRGQMWPLFLATEFSQVVFEPFLNSAAKSSVPLRDPYWLRKVEIDETDRMFDWLEENNVKTFPRAKLVDLSRDGKRVTAVEIAHKDSGILRTEQIVWTLTSEETMRAIPKAYSKIYNSEPVIADWMWTHYGLEIEVNRLSNALNDQWIAIGDLGLPWTHDNFIIGLRGRTESSWDIWTRRPTNQRFQRSYIEELGRNIIVQLKNRMPKTEIKVHLYPLEIEMDENILGPVRYPLFRVEELKKLKTERLSQFYFLSHEQTGSHSLAPHLKDSQALADVGFAHWKKELLKRQKKGMTDDRTLPTA